MTTYEDDDDRDSSASSVILAFLLGGLTGAAVALLYAPRSGKETRDLLSERLACGLIRHGARPPCVFAPSRASAQRNAWTGDNGAVPFSSG